MACSKNDLFWNVGWGLKQMYIYYDVIGMQKRVKLVFFSTIEKP